MKQQAGDNDDTQSTPDAVRRGGAIAGPRWQFLAEASELLDTSLEYEQTLANVLALAVPRIADYAIIALLSETACWIGGGRHTAIR